jgi:hypothetical protein
VKGSHEFAELKQLYALKTGRKLRTAQLHAKTGHPDWVQFVSVHAGKALKAEEPTKEQAQALSLSVEGLTADASLGGKSRDAGEPGDGQGKGGAVCLVAPEAMRKPEAMRSVEEHVECEAWECFVEACEQRRLAMLRGDAMAAVGFVKIAGDAQKSYYLARDKRVRAEVEMGRLKPVSAWHGMKAALAKIAGLIQNLEEIGAAANPANPMLARGAITTWKHTKFVPEVERLLREVEGTLAAA